MEDIYKILGDALRPEKKSGKFLVLQKGTDTALTIIRANSSNLLDYINSGHMEHFSGTKNECLDFIRDWWDENDILEEDRIHTLLTD